MSGPIVLVLRLLLALVLYAFLSSALWMMWRELVRVGNQIADRKVPPIRLEIRTKAEPAVTRAYAQPEVILGRDPFSDVPISDAAVSARHALLSFHQGQWWIVDLGSKNGTRLNREEVTGPTVVTSGDEIKCGQARVVITLDGEPRGSSPTDPGANDA